MYAFTCIHESMSVNRSAEWPCFLLFSSNLEFSPSTQPILFFDFACFRYLKILDVADQSYKEKLKLLLLKCYFHLVSDSRHS